jgi:hypothetical protein
MPISGEIKPTADFWRIGNLPKRQFSREQAERDVRELTPLLTTAAGKRAGAALRPEQAFILREFFDGLEQRGACGAYASLTVGGGKTLLSFLAPTVAEAKRPVLFIPDGLRDKTFAEFANYAKHWVAPSPPPQIVGYKEASRDWNVDLLERLKPDLYILDECDMLANQDGSVTKRIARDVDARGVPVLAMTGTSGRWSITDFSHFLTWALKEGAPVPLDPDELEAWALALDEKRPRFGRSMDPGVLCDLTELDDTEGMSELGIARAMFRQRISETPGCIILDGDSCDQPLTIERTWAPEDPKLETHFAKLRREKLTPDDWDLTDPLSEMACEAQLGTGFTYVPDPRPPADWCECRRIFARFVRARIEATADSRRPLDTEQAVVKAHRDHPIVAAWLAMKPTFKYVSRAEWYSGSVLDTAAAWAERCNSEGGRGLIWVQHEAFGVALSQLTGLSFYGAQGRSLNGERIENANPRRVAILSVGANLRGRNLQAWHRNYLVGCVQSAKYLEQLLGRTHRAGQTQPVEAEILFTSGGSHYAFEMLCKESRFVLASQGQKQKVLRATIRRLASIPGNGYRWISREVD